MSAENLATVQRIEEVKHHPNADRLDLVRVINFWAIVPRDKYKVGSLCVYIEPDSVLPQDREWASAYLRYTKRGRVRAVRLRGEWSEGIVVDSNIVAYASQEYHWNYMKVPTEDRLSYELWKQQPCLEFGSYARHGFEADVGDDFSDLLGVTKHVPPEFKHGFKEVKGYLPFDIPKTDENNWRKLRLDAFIGKPVDVTLKIDGQSFTAFVKLGRKSEDPEVALGIESTGICSRSLELKLTDNDQPAAEEFVQYNSNWHRAKDKYDVLNRLGNYCYFRQVSLALRGEVYGPGIQNFKHNPHSQVPELDIGFYSVWNIDEKRYEGPNDKHYYEKVCAELELPTVPMLEKQVPLAYELLEKYDSQLESLNGVPFEGVVIKGDQFHFKVINKNYDSEK